MDTVPLGTIGVPISVFRFRSVPSAAFSLHFVGMRTSWVKVPGPVYIRFKVRDFGPTQRRNHKSSGDSFGGRGGQF